MALFPRHMVVELFEETPESRFLTFKNNCGIGEEEKKRLFHQRGIGASENFPNSSVVGKKTLRRNLGGYTTASNNNWDPTTVQERHITTSAKDGPRFYTDYRYVGFPPLG
jgi:hypothetical protein